MKTFLAVIQLIPAIVALVKEIEKALPQAGVGAEKLTAFREIFETTYEGACELWPTVEKVIGTVVSLFNATGVFRKAEASQ